MKKIYLFVIMICSISCVGGKYTYLFQTGKQIDFSQGKWIMNQTESNSTIFDRELNSAASIDFKEIIGDSLFDLNSLRANKLVASKIEFELSSQKLKQLGQDTDCDYLINVRGNIVSNGAGLLSLNAGDANYSASNQSSVSIIIYNLESGEIISSSQVTAKDTAENSHFDNGNPSIHSSAETLMVKAAKNLIKKYKVNRLDE